MPLKSGSSQSTISENIRELHHGPTHERTAKKFGEKRAHEQSIAIAMETARKTKRKRRADGGSVSDDSDAPQVNVVKPPPDPSTSQSPNLLQQAQSQYPVLKNYDYGYVENFQPNAGYLEHWDPNDAGVAPTSPESLDRLRPSDLPMDKPGLEIRDPTTRPIDILGDIASHHMVNDDPVVKGAYQDLQNSMTPAQQDILQDQYDYAKKNEGETGSYEDWKQRAGMPGFFRGYTFQQWPKEFNDKAYTPEQRQKLDKLMGYLSGNSSDTGKARGGSVNAAMDIARRAKGGKVHVGPIIGATGGRADKRPMHVPDGAYVLTADHVSGIGEGNTHAGMERLNRMFPHSAKAHQEKKEHHRASGGKVPIYAADGEYVVHPQDLVDRFDSLEEGHKQMDNWQTYERQHLIHTLSNLEPPAQD
jgi:hypothetical protein